MKLEDFSYFLPDDLIAQHRAAKRCFTHDAALTAARAPWRISNFLPCRTFCKSDVLVINDSRVIPARIYGKKKKKKKKKKKNHRFYY